VIETVARAEPYSRLAASYDDTLGLPHLRVFVPRFEWLARHGRIRFHHAADLGCGTGLVASYLCRRWHVPVVAVDRSDAMLRRAAQRLARLPALLLRQDLRRLRLPHPVDLATIMFDTINHLLSGRDVASVFARIARHLVPGGHVLFDALTPALPRLAPRVERRFPRRGGDVVQRITWDPAHRVLRGLVVERRRGCPLVVERHVERPYVIADLLRWLRRAGLRPRAVLDATTLARATPRSPRVLVLAVKP
jgi:SAM-dependent methyltransferase